MIVTAFLVGLLVASSQAGVLDEGLLKSFSSGDSKKDVIVEFPSVAESVFSSSALSGLSGDDKRNKMVDMLRSQTQAMQAPIINSLSAFGIKENQIESFWVANKFAIKGVSLGPLQALSALPGAFTVREPFKAKAFPLEASKAQVSLRQTQNDPQWNIKAIDAPSVWATGNIGSGAVVGIIDTGVNQYHIALASNYKNDQYSWKDAFGVHNTPYDGNGHGTHCTGTICGNANGIGVAPGAKWMACRGLDDQGSGSEVTLSSCGQWMACPSGNSTANCTGMPNIVSNSWGGLMGGQTWFNSIIATWKKLGIIGVFAIGNSGQLGCGSAGSPGDQADIIAVGSTNIDSGLSDFSSRGPGRGPGITMRRKPEVAAPGRDIISADAKSNSTYITFSGTSMACPNVAGAIALMITSNSSYTYATILKDLESNTVRPKLGGLFDFYNVCTFPARYPNNGYGSGIINVAKTLKIKK